MTYSISPMTREAATEIDGWHYEEPYSFYDLDADSEDRALFLDESNWPDNHFAVRDDEGLTGFFSFTSVEVATGVDVASDVDPAHTNLDTATAVVVGLGMEPGRTDDRRGREFVARGLQFAHERYDPDEFRLSVATFNERAISVYESLGFERVREFRQQTNGDEYPFVEMRLSADQFVDPIARYQNR